MKVQYHKWGIDLNVRDCCGRIPLALDTRNGNLLLVKLLIDKKANLKVTDNNAYKLIKRLC